MNNLAEVRFEDGSVEMMEIVGGISKVDTGNDADCDCNITVEI